MATKDRVGRGQAFSWSGHSARIISNTRRMLSNFGSDDTTFYYRRVIVKLSKISNSCKLSFFQFNKYWK